MDSQVFAQSPRRISVGAAIAVGALLVIAVLAGAAYASKQHARAVARDALQAKLRAVTSAAAAINARIDDLASRWNRFDTLNAAALAAGNKRHDNAQNGDADPAYMYEQAKAEYTSVRMMRSVIDAVDSDYESIGDKYASVLGNASVAQLRSHSRAAYEAELDGLSNWERAIEDIKDSLQTDVQGGWGFTADTSNLYETSEEDGNRANTSWTNARNDLAALAHALDRKAADLQHAIATT